MTELLSDEDFAAASATPGKINGAWWQRQFSAERATRKAAEDEARRVFKIAMEADHRTVGAEAKLAAAEAALKRVAALDMTGDQFVLSGPAGALQRLRTAVSIARAILNPSEKAPS